MKFRFQSKVKSSVGERVSGGELKMSDENEDERTGGGGKVEGLSGEHSVK